MAPGNHVCVTSLRTMSTSGSADRAAATKVLRSASTRSGLWVRNARSLVPSISTTTSGWYVSTRSSIGASAKARVMPHRAAWSRSKPGSM